MPFKVGDKRPEKAGRKPGTVNKNTKTLHDIAERNGCDPFEVLIWFAKGDHKSLGITEDELSPELRQKSAKDACEYLHPKKKAVEHSGSIDGARVSVSLEEFLELQSDKLKES